MLEKRPSYSRLHPIVELAIAFAIILCAIQFLRTGPQSELFEPAIFLALLFIGLNQFRRRRRLQAAKEDLEWRKPLLRLVLPSILIAGVIIIWAYQNQSLHWGIFLGALILYPPWALFQHYIFTVYMQGRFLESMPNRGGTSSFFSAILFSITHLPNPLLAPVTLPLGFVWMTFFRKYKNIYAIAMSHGVIGASALSSLPNAITHNFLVGNKLPWDTLLRIF